MRISRSRPTSPLYGLLSLAAYASAQSSVAAPYDQPSSSANANSDTQTLTVGPTLTTTLSIGNGATVTVQPVTTLLASFPAGGSLTAVANGSSTNSYYVYSTYASSLDMGSGGAVSLCFDCCLWPCITSGMQPQPTGMPNRLAEFVAGTVNRAGFGAGRAVTVPATCPTVVSGTGTTTIYTTHTLTRCEEQPVCPNPGWGIIGQPNSTEPYHPGASTVYTTNANGTTSFVQIPTTRTAISVTASMTSGVMSSVPPAQSSAPGPSSVQSSRGSSVVASIGTSTTASSDLSSQAPTASSSPTSPSPALPTCPYSDGEIFTDYYGSQFSIQCDTLFTDPILDTQTQVQLSDCILACDKYNRDNIGGTQCRGASWISGQSEDNCLIFEGTTPTPRPGTWSATLISYVPTPPTSDGNETEPAEPDPIASIGSIITPSTQYGPDYTPVNRLVTTETVTATTASVSIGVSYIVSYIVSTVAGATQTYISYIVSTATAPGPTQTETLQLGADATATIYNPGPTVTTYADRTVTQTATLIGPGGTETLREISTALVTTTAPTETTTVYVFPTSSSSSSFCRLYPTEYLNGRVPVRKAKRGIMDGLVDVGGRGAVAAAPVPGSRPGGGFI
ncbi:hypothetical protein D0869_16031 [Hortaea werneckii]|uniref:Apple domain-containing protein n=1 Tax=Hortaea werneckii TaxID=91943 RepID=A0A3M6Y0Q9_HORWE|nr:hypothetical protein KC334_g2944 [Hortaea werneckii]KAI7022797.1 hypothetical protein KC355_g1944 [Hortaea werneckii]KAI7187562.1 hypothetical protein KC324_g6877 [Hortaea werneckii]KAI7575524.1 hypothetical protein KC316_g11048 [Hortaea werneckii]KAI7665164.1 hypothetical protein KC318_g7275 [Hortaea werneckii]